MNDFVPVNVPDLGGNERRYVLECLDTGWISSEGPFILRFEEQMARRFDRRHGVAVSSGSAALDIAVAALELGPGDEVIVPSFTIISCAAAIVRAGAVPVVVDSDRRTWNMDAAQVARNVTSRTRAILVVHIYGLPCDLEPILAIAAQHGLRIIEDAAEMHGQKYRGLPCGSFGDISIFSFYPNKHVTCGEGGMLLTDDSSLAESCRSLRNLCFQPERRFVHDRLGWNYRMTNLQAALGCAQLERLDDFVERKRRLGQYYLSLLSQLPALEMPLARTEYAESIFWVFGVVLEDSVPFEAAEAMRRLTAEGIGVRPFFWPLHEQPVLRKMGLFSGLSCPVAERLARRGFYIPSGLGTTRSQQERVVEAMHRVFARITE